MNCAYAAAGIAGASRCGIVLRSSHGAGLAIFAVGTVVEYAAVNAHAGISQIMLLVAFGAVITGAACDAACGYVFDSITLPCLALLLLVSIESQTLAAFSVGVLVCGGALMMLYAVTRGRGLGLGDVKLACCIGAAAGAVGGVEAIGIAF
ncbi:MAG TPA: prepilin peptidase, partial [Candidatus Baltobacteraceae bacterium]|nr:prepilin peptidase [Candidatus Baltobacteraceae bacterium]